MSGFVPVQYMRVAMVDGVGVKICTCRVEHLDQLFFNNRVKLIYSKRASGFSGTARRWTWLVIRQYESKVTPKRSPCSQSNHKYSIRSSS